MTLRALNLSALWSLRELDRWSGDQLEESVAALLPFNARYSIDGKDCKTFLAAYPAVLDCWTILSSLDSWGSSRDPICWHYSARSFEAF